MRDLARGDLLMAGQWLLALSTSAPDHPEVLRWRGSRHLAVAEWADAVACLSRSAELRPGDFPVLLCLTQAQEQLVIDLPTTVGLDPILQRLLDESKRIAASLEP